MLYANCASLYHLRLCLCYTDGVQLLDLLFPKRCVTCRRFGAYLCSACFANTAFNDIDICGACSHPTLFGKTHPSCQGKFTIDGTLASMSYKGPMKKLLYQFKYRPYLSDLTSLLSTFLYEGLIQKEQFHLLTQDKPILVPIPLSADRYRQRGYNQAQLLAQSLGKKLRIPVKDLLFRTRTTVSQTGLKRDERQKNIKEAFTLQKGIVIEQGTTVLLVDDVVTSGATFNEAAKILKKAGAASVWGIALARHST